MHIRGYKPYPQTMHVDLLLRLPGPNCPMRMAEQLHAFDKWDPPGSASQGKGGVFLFLFDSDSLKGKPMNSDL